MNSRKILTAGAVVIAIAIGGGFFWWQQHRTELPDGFSRANGRIEAKRVDVALKFAGRIAEVVVDEGEMVAEGALIARIDATELEAEVRAAEAATRQAQQELAQAKALVTQREGELALAKSELKRTELRRVKPWTGAAHRKLPPPPRSTRPVRKSPRPKRRSKQRRRKPPP